MKGISLTLLSLLFLAACGTLSIERCQPTDAPSPVPPLAPPPAAPAAPAPSVSFPPTDPALPMTPVAALAYAQTWEPGAISEGLPEGRLSIVVQSLPAISGHPGSCSLECGTALLFSGLSETLFQPATGPGGTITTQPQLASRFEMARDLSGMTMTLRSDVKFHESLHTLTARDIEWTLATLRHRTNYKWVHPMGPEITDTVGAIDVGGDLTVAISIQNPDHRWPLRPFAAFSHGVPIFSEGLNRKYGFIRMDRPHTGTGPYKLISWTELGAETEAFVDYHDKQWVKRPERVSWIVTPSKDARKAILLTLGAHIAEVASNDIPEMISVQGSYLAVAHAQGLSRSHNLSFDGNYWLEAGQGPPHTGLPAPWIGDPYEWGSEYNENTPTMRNATSLRNAISMMIDRKELLTSAMNGIGWVNHQPYISINHPLYRPEFAWPYDPEESAQILDSLGYTERRNEQLELFINITEDPTEEAIANWLVTTLEREVSRHLGINIWMRVKTYDTPEYSSLRAQGVAGAITMNGCAQEHAPQHPFDWPLGLSMSGRPSQHMAGQALPYAEETYETTLKSTDRDARYKASLHFHTKNRELANCIGLIEERITPVYNADRVSNWTPHPTVNLLFGGINNIHTIRMVRSEYNPADR